MNRSDRALRFFLAGTLLAATAGCTRETAYWREIFPQSRHADGGRFGKYTYELQHPDLDPKEYIVCTMAQLRAEPARWRNVPVKIRGVFNLCHDAAVGYYTRYTPSSHLGFSAWDPRTRLWIPSEREKGHALFFMRMGSPWVWDVQEYPAYQPVMIYGVGTDILDQGICIDVERIETLSGVRYTEEALVNLKTADEAAARQDWAVARDCYRKAAGIVMPEEALSHAHAGWADAAEHLGSWAEAAAAFDRACGYDAENWERVWGAGRCHLRLESWGTAADRLDRCDAILARSTERPSCMREIQTSRATAHAQAGRFSLAAGLFEKLVEADPRDGVALNNYAYALLSEGKDREKSLGLARRAADVLCDRVQVLATLGWACLENGNGAEAVVFLQRANAAAPADAEIAFRYAQSLVRTGKPVHARAILSQVAKVPGRWGERSRSLIQTIDADEKKLLEAK